MTYHNLTPHYTTSTLGFDRIFDHLERMIDNKTTQVEKYPPHNIVKSDENQYIVELAIAGFSESDIDITVEDGNLVIKGSKVETDSTVEYLHRGIGNRSFTKTLKLADTIEVRGAEYKNGILRIGLENVIPDHKKPRKIQIGQINDFRKPELLNE